MRTFSKIIALVLCAMMLFSQVSFASVDTDNITTSYVEFSKDDGGNIIARAMLHNNGADDENAKLIIAAYKGNNVEVAKASESVTITSGSEGYVNATMPFDNACIYKAFLWTAGNNTPLAEVANANAPAELKTIEINGVAMDDFSTSVTDYEFVYNPGEDLVLPVVKGIPTDNAVYATTAYNIANDKKSATATISVYNFYGSDEVQKTYTVEFLLEAEPVTLTNEDFDIVNKKDANMVNDIARVSLDESGNVVIQKKSSAVVADSFDDGLTDGILYTDFGGPSDITALKLTGSRWVTNYDPYYNRFALTHSDDSLAGSEYFAFKHPNSNTIDTSKTTPVLEFKVTKPCVVKVITQDHTTAYTGFKEEYRPYAVRAWNAYTGFLNKLANAATDDPYANLYEVPVSMVWDLEPQNPNRNYSWDDYYAKYYEGKTSVDKDTLFTNIAHASYFNKENANSIGSWYSYNYIYYRTYNAGDTVSIPRATTDTTVPGFVVVSPIGEDRDLNILDLENRYFQNVSSAPVGYAPDGSIEYNWATNGRPSNITYDTTFTSAWPYANFRGIEDFADPKLRGSYWGQSGLLPNATQRAMIYYVDPSLEGAQYFPTDKMTAAGTDGKNSVLEFNTVEPCKVSILAVSNNANFEGFDLETGKTFAKAALTPSYNFGSGIFVNADPDDIYTGDADVPFGMFYDRYSGNPDRLTWDEYYDKYFKNAGGSLTKDELKTYFAGQNMLFKGETGTDNTLFNAVADYKYAYTKRFPAGRVVIPKDSAKVTMARPYIVVITPYEGEVIDHVSDFETYFDGITAATYGGKVYANGDETTNVASSYPTPLTSDFKWAMDPTYKLTPFDGVNDQFDWQASPNYMRFYSSVDRISGLENAPYVRQSALITVATANNADVLEDEIRKRAFSEAAFFGSKVYSYSSYTKKEEEKLELYDCTEIGDVKWASFKVNQDCDVIIVSNSAIPANFLVDEKYGWKAASNADKAAVELSRMRGAGNPEVMTGGPQLTYYIQSFDAGDTVDLYNANNGIANKSDEAAPNYHVFVRVK